MAPDRRFALNRQGGVANRDSIRILPTSAAAVPGFAAVWAESFMPTGAVSAPITAVTWGNVYGAGTGVGNAIAQRCHGSYCRLTFRQRRDREPPGL